MKPRTILSTLLITPLAAQVDPDEGRGSFQSIPHFVTTIATPPALQLPGPRWKAANDIPATIPTPLATPSPGAPRYSVDKLFEAVPANVRHLLILDAISSGNDEIPLNSDSELDPGSEGWVAILFSVGAGATLEIQDGRADRHGDIYSLHLPGAYGVPAPLVGQIWLEQGREHMGIPQGHGVIGHDLQMPHIQNGTGPVVGYISVTNRFFFSLTASSAASHGSLLQATGLPPGRTTISGADILEMTWNDVDKKWSTPTLFRKAEELVGNVAADVDALAIDLPDVLASGAISPEVVMISLVGTAWLPTLPPATTPLTSKQAQVLAQSDNGPVKRVKDVNGSFIELILTGEVDSIAVLDPETAAGNRYVSNANVGSNYTPPHLSLSISNDGAAGGPAPIYQISVGNFTRRMPAGTVAIEYYQGLNGWMTMPQSAPRALAQPTVQFNVPLTLSPGRTFFRAKFTVTNNVTIYSWPVFLQQ